VRIDAPGADPDGKLVELEVGCAGADTFCLRWQNPSDAAPLLHRYEVAADASRVHQVS
jgi:hypothetical protein